ncbi:MAG: hypothetical protein CTY37_08570 [Methylotenera sp.]|nr:MAG: hypothetical protein CTY37_08570 [Methylotenera sp.]
MIEKPILSAKEMADFAMRPSHLKKYRQELLAHLEQIHDEKYVDEVKKIMMAIYKKRKGEK